MLRPRSLLWLSGSALAVAVAGGLLALGDRDPAPRPVASDSAAGVAAVRLPSPAAPPDARAARRATTAPIDAAAPDPTPAAPASGDAEAARWLLATSLEGALTGSRSVRDRERLADLLLEARALRNRETPGREREILLGIAEEFERIAGEPMGDVVSRLAFPGDLSPRPPREPAEALRP